MSAYLRSHREPQSHITYARNFSSRLTRPHSPIRSPVQKRKRQIDWKRYKHYKKYHNFEILRKDPGAPRERAWVAGEGRCNDEEAAHAVLEYSRGVELNPTLLQKDCKHKLRKILFTTPFKRDQISEVLILANTVFFEGKLYKHVQPLWSLDCETQFHTCVLGTTEFRQRPHSDEFETRIILSRPLLMRSDIDQRLVLSTLIHEMIHSYLFITRGPEAMEDGGHTPGFMKIASYIDAWIDDPNYLRLSNSQADLDYFKAKEGHGWNSHTQSWGTADGIWPSG
ncbi:MAG: hypothetical protein M1829_005132 [Trizodia sp. TS-e1964]|nr:MAG: hypothetical protein M1829_005132 [Trizodia sp. TS-e1964]